MKNLLIRYDVDGWAYHRRAEGMVRYAPPNCKVVAASNGAEYRAIEHHRAQKLPLARMALKTYEAVLLCDMSMEFGIYCNSRIGRLIGSTMWLHDKYNPDDWRTRGVADHRNRQLLSEIFDNTNVVLVHSKQQRDGLDGLHPNIHLAPYCVDPELFYIDGRIPAPRLRIGWNAPVVGPDGVKGFREIMVPLFCRICDAVEWRIETRSPSNAMGIEELRAWYNSLDVFLCTSVAEGGPQAPFEAAACGCVVLSTDVGQISDWQALRDLCCIGPAYSNIVEAEQTVMWFADAIYRFGKHPDDLTATRLRLTESVFEDYNAAKETPRIIRILLGEKP